MRCSKCGAKIPRFAVRKEMEFRFNTFRRFKCPKCNYISHTVEYVLEIDSEGKRFYETMLRRKEQ